MSSNQHYVPQFLLKNFSENKMVYRFDKKTGRIEQRNIKSVCSQDDFYNLSLGQLCRNQPKIKEILKNAPKCITEDTFNDIFLSCDSVITKIETITGEIVKKVLQHKCISVLNDEERVILCLFTAVQMLRTTHHRNNIKTIIKSAADKVKEFYENYANIKGTYNDWLEDNIGKNFDLCAKLMSITQLGELAWTQAKILFFTKNMFLIDTLDDNLYISDAPVVLDNKKDYGAYGNIGTLVPGIEIYLPVSSRIILAYHCKSLLPPYNVLANCSSYEYEEFEAMSTGGCIYRNDEVDFFNHLQLCYSDKYLIAKHDCFDYVKDMIRKYPQYINCTAKLEACY